MAHDGVAGHHQDRAAPLTSTDLLAAAKALLAHMTPKGSGWAPNGGPCCDDVLDTLRAAVERAEKEGARGQLTAESIAAWEKSARSDPAKPPGASPDGPYATGYWLSSGEVDEALAMMRAGLSAKPQPEIPRAVREAVEWDSIAFVHDGRCSMCSAWTRGGARKVGAKRWDRLCVECKSKEERP